MKTIEPLFEFVQCLYCVYCIHNIVKMIFLNQSFVMFFAVTVVHLIKVTFKADAYD